MPYLAPPPRRVPSWCPGRRKRSRDSAAPCPGRRSGRKRRDEDRPPGPDGPPRSEAEWSRDERPEGLGLARQAERLAEGGQAIRRPGRPGAGEAIGRDRLRERLEGFQELQTGLA